MKTISLIIFILLQGFLLNMNSQDSTLEKINNVVLELKNRYAPDKRTAIFDVSVIQENDKIILFGETNLHEAKNELINSLKNFQLEDSIVRLPGKNLGDKIYGIINLSVANMRVKPEHGEEMATQALLGSPLKVWKKKGGWYLVQTPDDYLGWVDDDGFQQMNKEEFDEWIASEKVIYIQKYGSAYSEAEINSLPVSDIVEGDILKKINTEGDFVKVEYPDKRTAYIPKNETENYSEWINNLETNPDNLLKTAKTFLGIPYLWGGTSSKGFDCSGFTKTVYSLNGIMLPRDASQQVNVGEVIDTKNGFENLNPGDLLFFGRKAAGDSKERVTHVALYIGNNEFIHASGSVRINSLDKSKENFSEYRFNTFIRAKRLLLKNGINTNGIKKINQ